MDGEALRHFVAQDYRRTVGAVALVCGDAGLAEDAVQDALAVAWERREEPDSPRAWVLQVALNRVRSGFRRRSAEARAYERWATGAVSVVLPAPMADGELAAALRRLPTRQREAVVLHYLIDLSVADVAAVLNVTEGTVKTCLHRGREALRTVLSAGRVEDADVR